VEVGRPTGARSYPIPLFLQPLTCCFQFSRQIGEVLGMITLFVSAYSRQ
jgi:hypothetical protein